MGETTLGTDLAISTTATSLKYGFISWGQLRNFGGDLADLAIIYAAKP